MYIDAYFDRTKNVVLVSEVYKGETILNEYSPELFFYMNDPNGKYTSVFGDQLSRMNYTSYKQFSADLRKYRNMGRQTFEGNVNPLFKTLEKYYKKQTKESIKKSYFDIETGWCADRGFAPASDPFNPVTAITIYNDWEDTLYSLSLAPDNLTLEQAEAELAGIENNLICESEEQMFVLFFEIISEANVISGWNSTLFDIPYLVNRVRRVLGNSGPTNFCLWGKQPKEKTVTKFEKDHETYDTIGRVHLDMLDLYQKYTYKELPSYRLDAVAELEVGEHKVAYQGTLDQLYRNDYRKFIMYARQDTMLLKKIDDKMDHISLAFAIAHENLVDVKTTMGAVALSDNALVLEAHRRNLIMRDRIGKKGSSDESKIAGAWVADPQPGLAKNIAITDLNSLYPSTYRALNLGNETILGQIRHTITAPIIEERMGGDEKKFAKSWSKIFWIEEVQHVFDKTDYVLTVDFDNAETMELKASDVYDFIFDNDLTITANGTILRNDKQSIYSSLLERWFDDRVIYQKRAKAYSTLKSGGIELPEDILKALT